MRAAHLGEYWTARPVEKIDDTVRLAQDLLEHSGVRAIVWRRRALHEELVPVGWCGCDEDPEVDELERAISFDDDSLGVVRHELCHEEDVVPTAVAREPKQSGTSGPRLPVAAKLGVRARGALPRMCERVVAPAARGDDEGVAALQHRLDQGRLPGLRWSGHVNERSRSHRRNGARAAAAPTHKLSSLPRTPDTKPPPPSPKTISLIRSRVSATRSLLSAACIVLAYALHTSAPVTS